MASVQTDENYVKTTFDSQDLVLKSAYLGAAKNSLDSVELGVCLSEAVGLFGHFLKYEDGTPQSENSNRRAASLSAFDVLMSSQKEASLACLPRKIVKEKMTKRTTLQ